MRNEAVARLSDPVRLSHPDRVIDPDSGMTKKDLFDYYATISPRLLAHVSDRPLSLIRCPSGIGDKCFFQKHAMLGLPKDVKRSQAGDEEVLSISTTRGCETLVQFGVVEFHIWGTHVDSIEQPDFIVFDLDPDEQLPFARVTEAAKIVRDGLRVFGLTSFVKTTGGKGLHVCVPIAPDHAWEVVKDFTKAVADTLAKAAPNHFVAIASKQKRIGKIFIDYLRNGRGATSVAPYSARARKGLPVSFPVTWAELDRLNPADFTIKTVPRLVAKRKDPWLRVATMKQRLPLDRAR